MTTAREARRRTALRVAVAALALVAAVAGFYRREIHGLWRFANLFREDLLVENFRTMEVLFPTRRVRRGGPVFAFERAPAALPTTFPYRDRDVDLDEFLARHLTTGLLVVQDDAIRHEQYFLGNTPETRTISWSVGKSFVSALVGIAIAEGHIRSVADAVTDYLPELRGSGYDGVPIEHVLQMASGIRFREDYGDPTSDINRMGLALATGTPLAAFVATLENERPSGTFHHYVSMDTQVLGMILERATGRSPSAYLEEKIWQRIGPESDAHWLLDGSGTEWAFGGLNVTLRDFARFGRLYLRNGDWQGETIVPPDWVRASVTPREPYQMPGDNPASDSRFGYGYQWWIPTDPDGEYMALGVYGQYIYVYPKQRLVIVKTSADPHFQDNDYESDFETLAAFRAIAAQLGGAGRLGGAGGPGGAGGLSGVSGLGGAGGRGSDGSSQSDRRKP